MSGDESLGRWPTGGWVPGLAGRGSRGPGDLLQDARLQRLQVPARVEPELLGQDVPDPASYAASASAWRPVRYSAVISVCQRPSRSGCSRTSASSCPVTSPPAPSSTRAAKWSSSSPRRTS